MIQGVIFDMDGLMFDTERLSDQMWLRVGHEFGFDPNPDFFQRIRGTNREGTRKLFRQEFGGAVDYEAMQDRCFSLLAEELERHIPVKPGLYELLTYLKAKGIPMAVASSTHLSMVLRNLELAGVSGYFSSVITGDMVQHGKPAPDIFLEAARALGKAPENCLVLEDSPNGVRAAAAAGCVTIMVPDLDKPAPELEALYTARADNLLDVRNMLDSTWLREPLIPCV